MWYNNKKATQNREKIQLCPQLFLIEDIFAFLWKNMAKFKLKSLSMEEEKGRKTVPNCSNFTFG